jgi:TolB-like protein/Flp pilus assembly protein TadD
MTSAENKAVFLSYASQDAEAAQRLAEALRAAGAEVWFDQNELVGGDAWDAKIRGQIASCAFFVPVISAATQARLEGYFRIEWKLAAQRTHAMAEEKAFLLPVVIDDTRDAEAKVPGEFRAVQWTRLPGGEGPAVEKFCARVSKLLGGDAVGPIADRAAGSEVAAPSDGARGRGRATPRRKPARAWWLPAAVGAAAVVALALWQPWRRGPTSSAAPAAQRAPDSEVAAELARVRARIVPERWQQSDFDAVTPTLDRLIQANPEEADAWALRSITNSLLVLRVLDSSTKPLDIGKTAANRALRLAPDRPLANLALGLHLTAMVSRGGDPRAGRELVDQALPGLSADALTRWASVASVWLGFDFDETGRRARAYLDAEPKASYPAWILGLVAFANRRADEATEWLERAASDDGIPAVRALGTLSDLNYYLRADLAATRSALDRLPARYRFVHRVVFMRWLVTMAEQRWDEALQDLAQLPDAYLADTAFNGPKALLAGIAHRRAGRNEAAVAQFREAERLVRERLATDAENEELRAMLALTLAHAGRASEARGELALIEPLVRSRAPNIYRFKVVMPIAQVYGVLGDFPAMAFWLRKQFAEPSTAPLTPASFRLDTRFAGTAEASEVKALLKEFSGLDQKPKDLTKADAANDKSVAVLAFANLSDDKANEYFSDGISEELLNVVAKIPGLKVSARTSAFSFKGKNVPIPEIAQQLGVAYVVDGSVRKAGDKVRITAQLIKAADGFQVWSDTFTREVKDVFAVQDEIAGLIAQNLRLKISGPRDRAAPAPEVYALILQARYATARQTNEAAREAIELYRQALAREPKTADAWAEQALAYVQLGRFGGLATADAMREARLGARRTLDLDPEHPQGLLALAWVQRTNDRDWRGAIASFRRALAAAPENVTIMGDAAICWLNVGFTDEALALSARAVERDPLNARAQWARGAILLWSGQPAPAVEAYRRAVALAPMGDEYHSHLARALSAVGRYPEALQEAGREPNERFRLVALATVQYQSGDRAGGDRTFNEIIEKFGDPMAGYLANLCAIVGKTDEAFRWWERGYETRDAAMAWVKANRAYGAVTADPRWEPFLRKMGLADDQLK